MHRGFPSDVDVAIVGAGAAGIGAARRLAKAGGISVLVLEARDRIGGRVWTITADTLPVDLGGEWLHSADRNILTGLAEQAGLTLNRVSPEWITRLSSSGETKEAEREWLCEWEAFYAAIHRTAQQRKDVSASTLLVPGGRWNALLDAVSTWASAVELDRVSVKDSHRYEDTGTNWRVEEGLGALIISLAEALPITFGAVVSVIDHRGRRVRLETGRGVVTADRVIVTVPTAIIAEGRLRFVPALADKVKAAGNLPLGVADKVILRLDGELPRVQEHVFLVGSTRRRETMNYQVCPMGRPRIQCFFGGRFAAELERKGIAAMAAFATDELVELFGNDIRQRLTPFAASFWRKDPFALGSYSYALPGHADDRANLSMPVDGRLFFAGEACSKNFFSTVHGAYESGVAAAEAALGNLHPAG